MRYNWEKMGNCASFVNEVITNNLVNKYILAKASSSSKKYFFISFPSDKDLTHSLSFFGATLNRGTNFVSTKL